MTAAEKEYGGALYALAAEEHCEDAVLEGLTLAADAFRETPGYLKLVQNPAVPRGSARGVRRGRARLCAEFFEDTVREIRTRHGCGLPAGV